MTKAAKVQESDEQVQEAWERWVNLMPVSDPELDGLLCWATHQAGERSPVHRDHPPKRRREHGTELSAWERVAIRYLLAGRCGATVGRKVQSPPDGMLAQRWREMQGGKNVPTSST